eukprot:scaffold2190_cov30-Prasinocladus_malaysianus.AAC.1
MSVRSISPLSGFTSRGRASQQQNVHIACPHLPRLRMYSPKDLNIARGSPSLHVPKAKTGLGRFGLRDRLGKLKVRLPAAAGRP